MLILKTYINIYIGYGYAKWNGIKIYDLSMSEFFENWDLKPVDRTAYFICQNCTKRIKKCKNLTNYISQKAKRK